MNLEEIKKKRKNYLYMLNKITNSDIYASKSMWDLGASLRLEKNEIRKIVNYLIGEGFIKTTGLGGLISITHDGIKKIESDFEDSQKSTNHYLPTNITNIENMINSKIDQSTSKHKYSNNYKLKQNIKNNGVVKKDRKASWQDSQLKYLSLSVIIILLGSLIWYYVEPRLSDKPVDEIINGNTMLENNDTNLILNILYLDIRSDINLQNIKDKLRDFRKEKDLRPIFDEENEKYIKDIPSKTYFFIHPLDFSIYYKENYLAEFSKKTRINKDNLRIFNYYEVYKIKEDELYVLGFISNQDIANEKIRLNGVDLIKLTIYPYPFKGRNNLVFIPVNRIFDTVHPRRIPIQENGVNDIYVLDMVLL